MTEIQGGRWDEVLRRVFPVKGGAIAPRMAPELVPVVMVQDFEPELYRVRGERLLWDSADTGPVAGQYAQVNLRNDSTDHLVIVEHLFACDVTAATDFILAMGNNAVGLAGSVAGRDSRVGFVITAGSVSGVIRTSTEAAITGARGGQYYQAVASQSVDLSRFLPVVLAPSAALFVWDSRVNQQLYVSFGWRERPVEPSELF